MFLKLFVLILAGISTIRLVKSNDDEAAKQYNTQYNRFDLEFVQVKVANRMFLDHNYTVKQQYRETLQQYYNSDVISVKKENPEETARIINDWVKEETSGMIPSIINSDFIKPDFVLAESSAIYFKGSWKYRFNPEHTKKICFYKLGHKCEKMEMMMKYRETFRYAYIDDLKSQFIDLPYKDGGQSMLIVLPNKEDGIDQLVRNIKHYPMNYITSKLSKKLVNLGLPKFSVEYENDNVIPTLKSMNISRAFSDSAELYDIVNENDKKIRVSKMIQKTKIVVNEEGAEAASVSVGQGVFFNGPIPMIFKADHPFLYFIKDQNNNILFAGRYDGP